MSSDSEDDPDYVPTTPKNDGLYSYSLVGFQQLTNGSTTTDSDSSDSNPDNERSAKRKRTSPPKPAEEEALKKM